MGLVLGAGGTVGCAYHAGVLYSVLHHLRWDARDAASIVGTSAGSLVGALLRCGVDPVDLVALTRGTAVSAANATRLGGLRAPAGRTSPNPLAMLSAFRPPTMIGALRTLRHQSIRPLVLSAIRSGSRDVRELVSELDTLGNDGWPLADLRICAVDAVSGRRRVLDGGSGVALSTAVAASCAVPGVFSPQRIGQARLIDGGVHSLTNIDTLDFGTLDEVWVVAPMAGRTFRRPPVSNFGRIIAARLRAEMNAIPAGMRVRLFVPGVEASGAMGLDLMATDRSDRTVLAGFLETGDLLAAS